jgi:hypothetical protein
MCFTDLVLPNAVLPTTTRRSPPNGVTSLVLDSLHFRSLL